MPRSFTDAEREQIVQRLLEAGRACWDQYGIKRTSVEDLAGAAGISKGAFYLFFASKELFFFEVLEQTHQEIKQLLLENVQTSQGSAKQRFVEAIMTLYNEMKQNKWLVRLMGNKEEYEYLARRLPRERIEQHIVGDDQDTKYFLELLGITGGVQVETVSAALRSLFFILLHREDVGEEQVDGAFRLLLEGLAIRITEEALT